MEITKHNFKLAEVTKDIEDIYYKEVLPDMFTNKTFCKYSLLNGREKYRNVFRYSDSDPETCLMWFKVNPKTFRQPDYILCTYFLSFHQVKEISDEGCITLTLESHTYVNLGLPSLEIDFYFKPKKNGKYNFKAIFFEGDKRTRAVELKEVDVNDVEHLKEMFISCVHLGIGDLQKEVLEDENFKGSWVAKRLANTTINENTITWQEVEEYMEDFKIYIGLLDASHIIHTYHRRKYGNGHPYKPFLTGKSLETISNLTENIVYDEGKVCYAIDIEKATLKDLGIRKTKPKTENKEGQAVKTKRKYTRRKPKN